MTVYRDAAHCIARVMSIETIDGTAKSDWQNKYQSGFPELRGEGSGLSAADRLAQDAMTRALLHRHLSATQWHALVARRSINDNEVMQSVHWLASNAVTPAHYLFRLKSVTAWVMPKRAEGQKSTRSLPDDFYLIHTWDNEGKPEGTLRRWKSITEKWLSLQFSSAHRSVEDLLVENDLKVGEAA